MKTTLKRFFSLLLVMTMLLSMVPTAVFAAETESIPVTEPTKTIAVPETTEASATEAETEEPTTETTETETTATEHAETEESIVAMEQIMTNASIDHMILDGFERDIQLPGVDDPVDRLPDDENRFFEVYDFGGVECVRNYIGKTDANGSYVEEIPGDYKGFDGQWLAAVLEFEGVVENGILSVFDENTVVIINGTQCATELLDDGIRVRATYIYQLQAIEVYNISLNITAPVVGEEAVFEAEYASATDDRYTINTEAGQNSVNGIRWLDYNTHESLEPGDKFEFGHFYNALIYIKAGTGCKFSENITASVNGMDGVYVASYSDLATQVPYDETQYRVVVVEFKMEDEYDIYIENGFAYNAEGTVIISAKPGDTVTLMAGEATEENRSFKAWEVISSHESGIFAEGDDCKNPTTFIMPEGDVELKAVYLPQIRDVHVAMDLPEAGEAPVYTAESRTEGVSIGEITWHNTSATYEKPVGENEILDYDQGYRVRIELLIDDEHVFAENVSGCMNGEQSDMYIDEDGNWFLDYCYDTGVRKYTITVDGGYAADMDGNIITKAALKEQFRVTAEVPKGQAFDHWEVPEGRVIIGWPEVWATSPELECYMLEEDVVFQAVFTDLKDVPIMIVDDNGGDLNESYDISQCNSVDMLVRKGNAMYPEDIIWSTSSAAIATVEQPEGKNYWNLVFHKPGTVNVTATDAYGVKDSVKITGYYLDTAKTFTVTSDVPSIGLQVGERARMKIFGTDKENELSPVEFDYTVSKEGIAEVREGWIEGIAPGAVTITAKLRNDPAGRKVTLKVTVIEAQIEDISLTYNCVEAVDEDTIWLDDGTCYTVVYLNSEDFATRTGSISLTPMAKNSQGSEVLLKKSLFKWVSSNTKVAKLNVNSDGTATVTIPKKASGMARITLTANDKTKHQQIIVVHVRDFAPKLAATNFTMDWWKENASVPLNLTESYGNTIRDAAVFEYNKKTKDYSIPSSNFSVVKDAEDNFSLIFGAESTIKKGTVKAGLNVNCADGKTYKFLISITVQNKQPKVTLIQLDKLNTFYCDSQASLGQSFSTSGESLRIESIKAVGDNKTITILPGTTTLAFTEAFRKGEIEKVDPNMVLEIKCYGYEPFETTFKVSTQTSKITVASDPGKLTVTHANTEKSIDFKLVDTKTGENLSAYVVEEKVYIPKAAYLGLEMKNNGTPTDVTDDYLTATFTDSVPTNKTAAYEITTPVQKDNWREIKWSGVKITYTPKTPTVALDKKTLTLNSTFTEREDRAIVTLSDTGLSRWDLDFELACTDKGGSKAWNTAQQLSVVCKDGVITAKLKDSDAVVEPAKCKFEAIPEINGIKLAKVSVTVDVKADTSKVRIDYSTVKLNTYMARYEIFSTDAFMGNDLELLGFKENGNRDVEIWYANGQLHTKLKTNDPESRYIFELTPKVKDELTGQIVYTPNKLKLTVQTYRNDKITIDMGIYGTLDTLNPDSAMYVYVSKLTNAANGHEKLKALVGQDGNLFDYSVDEYGQITLKLKPGQTYETGKTYLLRFTYEVFNQTVVSKDVKVKVTQGKYKPVISPPNAQVTLSSRKTTTLLFSISLTGAEGARLDKDSIRLNTSKTAAALGRAIGSASVRSVSADGRLATVAVTITYKDYLDSGKKYALAFDVTPVGNASNVKAQTVTASILAK